MLDDVLRLSDDFPPVSDQQWRTLVESQLQGVPFDASLVTPTYDGFNLQPLYTRADLPEGRGWQSISEWIRSGSTAPSSSETAANRNSVTSGRWELRQEHAHADVHVTNQFIQHDVQGGVGSLLLRLDAAARVGMDPDDPAAGERVGYDGIAAYHQHDLQSALANVDSSQVAVALDAGAAFIPAAVQLASFWNANQIPPGESRGAFNADPLAALARDGQLPYSIDAAFHMLGDLAAWTHANRPRVTAVSVDTSPYHHAGATDTQDLAIALATGVAYLRAMERQGLPIDAAARQILFRLCVDTDLFFSIAKLRAARRLWCGVIHACGGSRSASAVQLHVRTSPRVFTRRDPQLNLLRNMLGVLAAGLAGSEFITSVPFDVRIGLPDEWSRRLARNAVLILQHESHLDAVTDPAGGSWFVEKLTYLIAQEAWRRFQEIERNGGIVAVLTDGSLADQVDASYASRLQDIAQGRRVITGVTGFIGDDVTENLKVEAPRGLGGTAVQRRVENRCDSRALAQLAAIASSPRGVGNDERYVAGDRLDRAVSAAGQGSSIGQLAQAFGFGAEITTARAFEPRNLAEPFEAAQELTK